MTLTEEDRIRKIIREELTRFFQRKENATGKSLYTPNEVMEIFDISRPTFQDWCSKGVLKKVTIPGQRRVFVDSQSVKDIING